MTISSSNNFQSFLGNGVTSSFVTNFVPNSASNLILTLSSGSSVGTIVASGLYSVSIGAPPVGSIWPTSATITYPLTGPSISSGTTLTVSRLLPLTQPTAYSNQGNLWPQAVETGLDTLEMQIQQISNRTGQFRGTWASGVLYNYGDLVLDGAAGANTGNYYMASIANISGTWATDLTAGDWIIFINVTSINANVIAAAASAATATTQAGIATVGANTATTEAGIATVQAAAAAASAATSSASALSLTTTSTTSNTIGTGAFTFTVAAGKAFSPGVYILITDQANSANYIHGSVTSYSGTTLVMNSTDDGGSGTKSAWNITPSLPNLSANAAGTSNQIQYNNSGVLGGISPSTTGYVLTSAGISSTPLFQAPAAGTSNQIQFNNSGLFGGISPATTGYIMTSAGVNSTPSFQALAATVSQGGTGVVTLPAYELIAGGTTTTAGVQAILPGTSGYVLTSAGINALPSFQIAGVGVTRVTTIPEITDSTDIACSWIPTQANIGSTASITIPAKGIITISFTGEIIATSSSNSLILGIRIGSTNYWPNLSQNGTAAYQWISSAAAAETDSYSSFGAAASPAGTGIQQIGSMLIGLDIQILGIPTGTQTVQVIAARGANNTFTIKGTAQPSHIFITVYDHT